MESKTKVTNSTTPYPIVYEENLVQKSLFAMLDRIVSSGGYNREECLRTVECYDPKEDCWTFIAPMRTPRARFQMAVLMVNETLWSLFHINLM